jgi:hypothetical protein
LQPGFWRTAARRASDLRSSAPPLLSSFAETAPEIRDPNIFRDRGAQVDPVSFKITRNPRGGGGFTHAFWRIGGFRDCLAERGGFELPVPISEQPDENMMSGCVAPRPSIRDRLRLKRLVGLYGRQHPKDTLPSCAMNDIATDVAAAIQLKGRPFAPVAPSERRPVGLSKNMRMICLPPWAARQPGPSPESKADSGRKPQPSQFWAGCIINMFRV